MPKNANIKKIAEILYSESKEDPFFSGGTILKLSVYRMLRKMLSSLKNIHPRQIDRMFHQCETPDEIENVLNTILELKKIQAPSKQKNEAKPPWLLSSPDW